MVAVAALWFVPLLSVGLAAAIVLGGVVLIVTGRRRSGALVVLMPVLVLVPASYVIAAVWFKPYRVPGQSMESTLRVGDRFLADRRDPSPSVGDVVVFHPPQGAIDGECAEPAEPTAPCPRATPGLASVTFVQRVVGGSGDTIAFRRGLVIRNGRPVDEPYAQACNVEACDFPTPITGTAAFRYWPPSRIAKLDQQ